MERIYYWFKEHSVSVNKAKKATLIAYVVSLFTYSFISKFDMQGYEALHLITWVVAVLVVTGIALELLQYRASKLGPKCCLCGGSTKWSLFFDPDSGVNRQTYKCKNRECGNRILIKG